MTRDAVVQSGELTGARVTVKDDPAWAINEKKREEAIVGTLKSGWCITNHHHQCPKEYVDKSIPKCNCPCHTEEQQELDANGNPIDWSFL